MVMSKLSTFGRRAAIKLGLAGAATALTPRRARAQNPKEVKIALVVPLSGPWARQGILEQMGAELAIEDVNKSGGATESLDATALVHVLDRQLGAHLLQNALTGPGAGQRHDQRDLHLFRVLRARATGRERGGGTSEAQLDRGSASKRRKLAHNHRSPIWVSFIDRSTLPSDRGTS